MKTKRKCICDKVMILRQITGKPQPLSVTELNKTRLNLFTERNSNGTCNLVLKGRDIYERYNKRIQDEDIRAICLYIIENPKRIVKLDLSYNEITDAGFFKLIKMILVKGRSSVYNLNMMYNNMTKISLDNLANYSKFIKLKYLRINGNDFGDDCGVSLANFLENNQTVQCLDIGETCQTLTGVAKIIAVLGQLNLNNTLRVLDFSRIVPLFNRYSYESKWLAYHIENLLMFNNTIIELHLQKNELVGHDVEYIVRGLKCNKTLLYLDLGFNKVADYGAELFENYLKEKPALILINLAGNSISDTGARALSFGLPYAKVRALDVSNNKISDDGILDILNTLKKCYYLRFLNIWGNCVGEKSCLVIQRMLLSGALFQHTIDVKIYEVDAVLCAAYYPNPADRNKHLYYNEMDFGFAQPICHIKRNVLPEKKIVKVDCKQRHKLDKTSRYTF